MKSELQSVHSVFAGAILREVPLAHLARFVDKLDPGDLANGNGCGNACGNNCATPIDPHGHLGLSIDQLSAVVADKVGLRRELSAQIRGLAERIG